MLSAAIAVANDTPEILDATSIGFCVFQSSPNQKTPTEYTTNEKVNRAQKATPVNLTFSLTALPMVRPMTRISLIGFHPKFLTELLPL